MTALPDITKLLLIGAVALIVALYSYFHARAYREGLPPIQDAFFWGTSFVAICVAFALGGRIGESYGMVTEGRVAALGMAVLVIRWMRARLGTELADWHK